MLQRFWWYEKRRKTIELGMKPKEKNEIFAWEVPQGEKQKGFGLLYKAFVKWKKEKRGCYNVNIVKRKILCEKKKKPQWVQWACVRAKKNIEIFCLIVRHTREINLRFLEKDIVIKFIIIDLSRVFPVIFLFKEKEFPVKFMWSCM